MSERYRGFQEIDSFGLSGRAVFCRAAEQAVIGRFNAAEDILSEISSLVWRSQTFLRVRDIFRLRMSVTASGSIFLVGSWKSHELSILSAARCEVEGVLQLAEMKGIILEINPDPHSFAFSTADIEGFSYVQVGAWELGDHNKGVKLLAHELTHCAVRAFHRFIDEGLATYVERHAVSNSLYDTISPDLGTVWRPSLRALISDRALPYPHFEWLPVESRSRVYTRGELFIRECIRIKGVPALKDFVARVALDDCADISSYIEEWLGCSIETLDDPCLASADVSDPKLSHETSEADLVRGLFEQLRPIKSDHSLAQGYIKDRCPSQKGRFGNAYTRLLVLIWLGNPSKHIAFELWAYRADGAASLGRSLEHLIYFWAAWIRSLYDERCSDGRTFLSVAARELQASIACADVGPVMYLSAAEYVKRTPPGQLGPFLDEHVYRDMAKQWNQVS